jgi:type IV pilus biogenesis protein PilP
MRNKHLLLPILMTIVCLPRIGFSSTDVVTVGELSAVQSETALLKAKGERAKAQREIDGEGQQQIQIQPYQSHSSIPTPIGGDSEESLPVVKLVYGSSGALRATLLFSSGFEVDAASGQDLPGGYKVGTIGLDSVVLTRSGKRFPLGFSGTAMPVKTGAFGRLPAPSMPGLPMGQPLPPVMP